MVVEDELALRETLEYNLAKQGYEVYKSADGLTALEIARKVELDLVLLDIMLPGLDGLEVCRILRQESAVPILMLTARDVPFDAVFTVCDNAARDCPVWLGRGRVLHFGFPDPAAATGSEAEKLAVFCQVRDNLRQAIFDTLTQVDDAPAKGVFYAPGNL